MNKMVLMRASGGMRSERGVMLLEALVALVIFSIGLLGLVALQARAISLDQDARYRAEAAILANQAIGSMWGAATAKDDFLPGKPAFDNWVAQVEGALPGASAYPPIVVWGVAPVRDTQVTVTVRWKLPSSDVRSYTTSAEVIP